jgi:hypothetical protein
LQRDHRLVGIIDGSAVVNQNILINQFPTLVRAYHRGLEPPAGLAAAVTLGLPLPAARLDRLRRVARHGCSVLRGLRGAAVDLAKLAAGAELPLETADAAEELLAYTDELHWDMAQVLPSAPEVGAGAYQLAHRFALCVAGSACVQLWLRSRKVAPAAAASWRDGLWLHACLVYLLSELVPGPDPGRAAVFGRLFDAVPTDHPVVSILPVGRW